MVCFLTLWAIYSLGWFLLSVFSAVVRGGHNAMMLRYAASFGLVSTAIHKLIDLFIKGGC